MTDEDTPAQDPLRFNGTGKDIPADSGEIDHPPPDRMWRTFQRRSPVRAVKINEEFEVLTVHGWQQASKDSYLIEEDGRLRVEDPDRFEAVHVETDALGLPAADAAARARVAEEVTGVPSPRLDLAALTLCGLSAPQPVCDFMLYSLDSPEAVEEALSTLEAQGKVRRQTTDGVGRFWHNVKHTVTCQRCGYVAEDVPIEGAPCPSCMRATLKPEEKK